MNDQNITDKIRKLLKLAADNPNVNEAAVAFAAAQDIATRHALDLDEISTDDEERHDEAPRTVEEITKRFICEFNGKAVYWKLQLADAVTDANGCKYFYNSHRGITAYGQWSDLDTTAIMFNAIEIQIERLARDAVKVHKDQLIEEWGSLQEATDCGEDSPRTFGRNFRLGAVHEIGHRLRSRKETVSVERRNIKAVGDDTTAALVRVDRAAEYLVRVDAAVAKFRKGLNLGGGSSFSGATGGGGGYAAGRAAGRTVGLGGGRALKS